MIPKRPSHHQNRLEAILAMYRDTEPRPGAERRHLLRLWHEYVYPLRARLVLAMIFTLLNQIQPYVWSFMGTIVVTDTILMVGRTIPPEQLQKHLQWTMILFFATVAAMGFATWQQRRAEKMTAIRPDQEADIALPGIA